jgi:glycosyltransferase involved in cell wall biosynthesis
VVTGIWPPDVGGPASHAPEVAAFLRARGHETEVVTTADRPPVAQPYAVRWTPRSLPVGVRHVHGITLAWRRARRADVVYSTGMFGRSAIATALARRPLVVKLTGDPAFERARARGHVRGGLDDFERSAGFRIQLLRRFRDWSLRRAARVVVPSEYLRERAIRWGVRPDRALLLPNPAPVLPELPSSADARAVFGLNGQTLVFAGRLTVQKALDVALEAIARSSGVSLVIAGDGPERARLERASADLGVAGRVRFLGSQTRERIFALFRAGDAAVLTSEWENFPHAAVEALAVGTPVLAAESGGVGEIVEHERNGLLVPPRDADALARAIERFFADEQLRERLRAAAAPSVQRFSADEVYGRLEEALLAAARR